MALWDFDDDDLMNSLQDKTALFSPAADWRSDQRGWWILLVFLGIFVSSISLTFHDMVARFVGVPEFRLGSDPPLYSIHEALITGICATVGLLLVMAITGLIWSYSRIYSHMAQWMSVLFLGPRIGPAFYIWLRCDDLFTERASSPWPTLDAYLDDPWTWFATYSPMIVVMLYAVWGNKRFREHTSAPQSGR